ncbi:MAG: hypothetical protein JO057_05185 [Chloroflexi bacterium]|nr:hypothetical protein [Chloroflexota bacterium]
MQTVVELSSSDQARKAATAWLAAYDTTLAEGGDPDGAHAYADVAYGVAATRIGLPVSGRRAA